MQPVHILRSLFEALPGEFPNLEHLFIERHMFYMPRAESNVFMGIPESFRAPRLRYLVVMGFNIQFRSPLSTTVFLSLSFDIPWAYSHPNPLVQQLSLVRQLETSRNIFNTISPSDDQEDQLLQRAVVRRITPYLRRFGFQSANAYLEALLPRVTIRLLEKLQLYFLDQLKAHLILPRRQFMSPAETVCLKTVRLTFIKDYILVTAFSQDSEFKTYQFSMSQGGMHLDRQLSSVSNSFHKFKTIFSPVGSLILGYNGHLIPSEWDNEADPSQWRELFRTFVNLKTLYIDKELVGQLSRFLQPDEGESPMDLVPELRALWYAATEVSDGGFFNKFINARQNAGRPISVWRAVFHR